MPNQPKTPARTFRIPDDVYDQIRQIAKERNTTRSQIVIEALTQYVQGRTK